MVSLPCANCYQVKRCRLTRTVSGAEYLCRPCRRSLGYATPRTDSEAVALVPSDEGY